MSLNKYASKCREFERELRQCLTNENIDALRKHCAEVGKNDWVAWVYNNQQTISAFLASTPSQRRKKKAWQDPKVKSHLVLAALFQLGYAQHMLEALVQHPLSPGSSYRDMVLRAVDLYEEVVSRELEFWPFDHPNPFENP